MEVDRSLNEVGATVLTLVLGCAPCCFKQQTVICICLIQFRIFNWSGCPPIRHWTRTKVRSSPLLPCAFRHSAHAASPGSCNPDLYPKILGKVERIDASQHDRIVECIRAQASICCTIRCIASLLSPINTTPCAMSETCGDNWIAPCATCSGPLVAGLSQRSCGPGRTIRCL